MALPLRTRFGRLVAAHRRRIGLTQEQLAAKADVSVDTISKIEVGATGARFPVIERIAAALDVDVADLFSSGVPARLSSQPLKEIELKLASLHEHELAWLKGVIDAALAPRYRA